MIVQIGFTMATLFQLSNLLVMPFWVLMIFLPHWQWTRRIAGSPWIAAPAALLYAVLVLPNALSLLPVLMNPSLAGITALLSTPEAATIAWVHFLAFDLFVGRWVYLDSRARTHHGLGRIARALGGVDAGAAGLFALFDRAGVFGATGNRAAAGAWALNAGWHAPRRVSGRNTGYEITSLSIFRLTKETYP